MTPRARLSHSNVSLRSWRLLAAWLALLVVGSSGCMSFLTLPGSREKNSLKELADDNQESPNLVAKYTHPYGMNYVKVEAISMVTGLNGTGEDPPPTPQRASLIAEMRRRPIDNPDQILASPDTSLVLVRGFLRPGIQEGDRFDVEVRVPSRGETTSLRGGWLLSSHLTELAVLGQQIRQGHVLGVAEGAIMVDPHATGESGEPYATQGRVLGGGLAVKSRPLGLVIDDRYKSVRLSQQIAESINDRFYDRTDGRKRGVATAKTDELVEVAMHAQYKDNVARYMRVLQNTVVSETAHARQERLQMLAEQIHDPLTAATAALQLEALGDDQAVEILQQALASEKVEVRFYAAEALAYLDETAAVDVLAAVAREERALRINALAALSAMDDLNAFEALHELLSVRSAETRYGAFRSLWAMNANDPLIAGENMNGTFRLHQLAVDGSPMIHLTSTHHPEIVLFGKQPPLKLPLLVEAGTGILINGMQGSTLTVNRFHAQGETEKREIEPEVDELIRAIVELGGNYPDVVQALEQAEKQGALQTPLRVDALPETGRKLRRLRSEQTEAEAEESDGFDVATPMPNLFRWRS